MQLDTINIIVPLRHKWLICFKGLQTSCMVWRWNRHYSTNSWVNTDDYHKKAHEIYCFSSPSLQPPPTLQIAHEGHLQNIVAEFGVVCLFVCALKLLFVYLLFWTEKLNKEGTLKAKDLKFLVSACCWFWFLNPTGKILRSGSYF